MTKTATKTYLVGVIERAISYFEVEAEEARNAAENWHEGEFLDRDRYYDDSLAKGRVYLADTLLKDADGKPTPEMAEKIKQLTRR